MASLPISALIFLCFLLLPYLSTAEVTLGSSLSTFSGNSSWLSPSEEFAFGFRQLDNSDLYLLAIWFNKIPEKTIVWYANGNNPAPRGSKLEVSAAGLELKDPGGNIIWDEKPAARVSEAAVLDTGNFVLRGNSSDDYVWQSFKNPTNTILPSQRLDLGSKLFSKLSETNFSRGRFELHFDNGTLTLNPIAWPSQFVYKAYYTGNTFSLNSSESARQLVFNESGDVYIETNTGQVVQLTSWGKLNPRANHYFRATLDFDGIFTEYAFAKNSDANQSWWPLRIVPLDMCAAIFHDIGRGPCGFNSYCSLQNGRPNCACPPGYVFEEPNNMFSNCKPNFWQGCGGDDGSRNPEDLYEFREFNNVDWPLGDYERLSPYSRTECEQSCLNDCSCAVAIYDSITCWKKKLPLSNGRYRNTGFSSKVLFKVRKEDFIAFGDNPAGRKRDGSILLGSFLLGGSVFFSVILLVAISVIVYIWYKKKDGKNVQDSSFAETNLRYFTYDQLNEATDGFKEELGRGSFGIVYKGALGAGSRNSIAVKKLDKLAQEREREFRTEVNAIGRIHHKNLVQLLGFCDQGVNRLLVYEFMGNGTLANILFALPRPEWNLRIRISLEIARGLVYLHEECNVPIIHCDIKPQNILLDEYFVAKISDFGLSKLLLSDQSRTRTVIRGTRGYVAPEWFKNVAVSAKVDVYSYGVMLLEIVCCRRSVEMELEEERRVILTDWAYDCYSEGRLDVLVNEDEVVKEDKVRLHKWLMIALWCIQDEPSRRPTMKMVLQMLEGFLEVPEPPCPSSFSIS